MSANTIASYKSLLAAQKQTFHAQAVTQEKLLEIAAAQARCEATLARIEADIAEILALLHEEEPTFADLVRDGEMEVDQLGAYIEAYNEGDKSMTLHEYLGLTAEQLVALLEKPEDYEAILGLTDGPEAE